MSLLNERYDTRSDYTTLIGQIMIIHSVRLLYFIRFKLEYTRKSDEKLAKLFFE